MHLLAVSDTLSSFSADVIDKLAQANAGKLMLIKKVFVFCFLFLFWFQVTFEQI